MIKKNSPGAGPFFTKDNFHRLCDQLSEQDEELKNVLLTHGYPPFWSRSNSFASLIHIILEQQVSLQSAKAAFEKLKQKLGKITPERLLALSDPELKNCYFSRQKTVYARHLAESIVTGKINLRKLPSASNDEIRSSLKQIKGIGDWTADIYLLFALQRTDIFPVGDLAMIKALKEVKKTEPDISREAILELAAGWQPYRSIATMLLWHHYIQTRNIRL